MLRRTLLSAAAVLSLSGVAQAGDGLTVRGTLPWHNFLSGPTSWNEADFRAYLDELKASGLNYVAFHCYTGGAERYAPYVEPIIRMRYRDVVPHAEFDTSLTARWGYRPLRVEDFACGTGALFKLPPGAGAFGCDAALLARDNADRYRRAQDLMRRVLEMAHQRGIRMAVGFEFGIWPLEFMSIAPPGTYLPGAMLPDPTRPASREILRATLDDILEAYPGIDGIWLWLHEHTMKVPQAAFGGDFGTLLQRDRHFFAGGSEMAAFTGVWSLEFIRQAQAYLARRAPAVQLVISGWGGGDQLSPVLLGLDKALPESIVFSCLSPGGGSQPHPPALTEISRRRPAWAIPWLESDSYLWHPQPQVSRLREQVLKANTDGLQGTLAIHWRDRDMRSNLQAFARFARHPDAAPSVEQFYKEACAREYGPAGAARLAAIMTELDRTQLLLASSPEYYPYDPGWGRLTPEKRRRVQDLQGELRGLREEMSQPEHRGNLDALLADLEFVPLLDEVGRQLEPAYRLKDKSLLGMPAEAFEAERAAAKKSLEAAPVEKLLKTYARRVRSRGDLGVLSSLNQKLWLEYRELADFLGAKVAADPK